MGSPFEYLVLLPDSVIDEGITRQAQLDSWNNSAIGTCEIGETMEFEQLRDQVMTLPIDDRAKLVRDLIESLDCDMESPEGECVLSAAWIDEIVERSNALHRGELGCDDWQVSLTRVRDRLADRNPS
ncbi:MAG: addiction module protein [Planctomycetota bacterium]|nr:addiction module protein [Planctomycetota bacterium]MDA0922006.1 addiction module protein [Planctomycetota bacterium]